MYIKFKRNLITIIGKTKQRQFFKRITGSLLSVVLLWSNLFIIPFSVSDVSVLYCGLEEHVHTEQCYDDDLALVCGLEEHTHTEECYTEPVKSSKSWLQELLNPSGASVETERSGGTSFTIYYTVPDDWIGSNKAVYFNVKRTSNGNWQQVEMEDTGKTYTEGANTYKVYKATAEAWDRYDNVKEGQIQLYVNGAWKEQKVIFSTQTMLTDVNGQIYIISGNNLRHEAYDPDFSWDEDYIYLDMSDTINRWFAEDHNGCYRMLYKKTGQTDWVYSDEFEQISHTFVYKLKVPSDFDRSNKNDALLVVKLSSENSSTITTGQTTWVTCIYQTKNLKLENGKNKIKIQNYRDYKDSDKYRLNWDGSYTPTADTRVGASRTVYFDATLSKLQISNKDVSSDYEYLSIPNSNGDGVYYRAEYDNGTIASGTMSRVGSSDVYSVTAPEGRTIVKIQFGSFSLSRFYPVSEKGKYTKIMYIPNNLTNPCFYADTSDDAIYATDWSTYNYHYENDEEGWHGGYWQEINTLYDAEKYKNTDIVDINTGTFTRDKDKLYLNTTLYDYYSDYEINGNNRDNYGSSVGGSHRNWVTYRQLNQALSDRYRSITANYPLYVGHFQPSIWGFSFTEIGSTLDLYSYNGDDTTDDYKKFFAINNSALNIGGSQIYEYNSITQKNEGKYNYTFQGLVGDIGTELSSDNALLPLFDSDFLLGNNTKNAVLGAVYEDVQFPFEKKDLNNDGIEYWVFDSKNTSLVMRQDTSANEYYLEDVTSDITNREKYRNVDSGSNPQDKYGFFPFNETATAETASTYNYGFGARLDLTFRLTGNGKVLDTNGNYQDIVFTFSGDDDVWVFIDGKLALDVGGAHSPAEGTLNFRTKQAYVNKVKKGGTSSDADHSEGVTNTFTIDGGNTDEHTLTMFYMERGMWESNMKLTFNFPDESLLEVEKQVDKSDVDDAFKDMFDDKELFTFEMKTVATHYGSKEAKDSSESTATKQDVPLNDDSGTTVQLSKQSLVTIFNNSATNEIHWQSNTGGNDDNRSGHYGEITLTNPISLTGQKYFQFDFLQNNDQNGYTPALRNLFFDLLDESGNSILKDSKMISASDCIVGTPALSRNSWASLKFDLTKMLAAGKDSANVKYIRIGYDHSGDVYIKNMSFLPGVNVSTGSVGFTIAQSAIPDYNTSQDGILKVPEKAVYTSNLHSASQIGSDGLFTLENGEKITFHNQFRLGSYMYIAEQVNPLFDTSWTMYEDGKAVTAFGTANDYIENPSPANNMINVSGNTVIDGRTEKYRTDVNDIEISNTGYPATSRSGYENTFVFRSYATPDKSGDKTKLKVLFTNKVKTGSLRIGKELAAGSETTNEIFTFTVRFYNVGGLGLEGSTPVEKTFTLTAGNSETFTKIPLYTQYDIYEIKSNAADISLDHVEVYDTTQNGYSTVSHSSTNDAYLYSGGKITEESSTASANNANVVFYNKKKTVTSLVLTKKWKEQQGASTSDVSNSQSAPQSIRVQLQRSSNNGSTWTAVDSYSNVTVSRGTDTWDNYTYTFEGLDKYYSGTNEYKYRVVELDSSGNVVNENTNFTLSGSNYTVGTYTTSTEGTGNSKKFTQTITNTLNPVVKIIVTKQWKDSNNTVLTGDDIPSANVTVQLQRKTNSTSWSAVTDNSYNNVSLPNGNSWTYTFENLPKYTGSTEYQYRVVELDGSSNPIVENGTVTVNGTSYKVTYSSLDVAGTNTYTQKIFNTEDSKIKISVTKVWQNSSGGTLSQTPASVNVRIRRKVGSGEWENVGEAQTLNSGNSWTYTSGDLPKKNGSNADYTYDVVEVGESGREITIGSTKYTVTYSNAINASDSNQTDWTITNKAVPTVSLEITKQSASDSNIKLQNVKFTLEKQDESGNSWYFVNDNIETGTDGKASVTGLLPGTYRLTEIKTAEGYSLLKAPIEIVIVNNSGTYSATVDNSTVEMNKSGDVYTLQLTVYNKQKFLLPATGGVNGFEFWILGGLCVIAVPLLLYAFTVYKKGGRKA